MITRLPINEHQQRLELYQQGMTDGCIGKALYLTSQAVYRWRKANGLPANRPKPYILPQDEDKRMQLYHQGLSDGEIGKLIGKKREVVTNWRSRRGLPKN